jgi:cell division protein FtsB
MARVLVGALAVAIIASGGGWYLYTRDRAVQAQDQKKIAELQQQVQSLDAQSAELKENLAKSQAEEERLSVANQELAKALAQARLTGKVPPLPPGALAYPPK